MVDQGNKIVSTKRQCELMQVSRSSVYYEATGLNKDSLEMMGMIDEEYTRTPFYGSRKLAKIISIRLKKPVNRKCIQRCMRLMGLEAICPKPNTSKANKQHKKYPYLLSNLSLTGPNQVWSSDITYLRLEGGFAYLVAIIDWYSRRVITWQLSNTLDSSFCVDALKNAIDITECKPQIFNTDQGSQFTCHEFTDVLEKNEIKISMDGKGRALDNIFVERLWRTVKYENVYLKGYRTIAEAKAGLAEYFEFYNYERIHQSLDYKTPNEVHYANAA
jgi:putative transposase